MKSMRFALMAALAVLLVVHPASAKEKVKTVEVPPERALDIDTGLDLAFAEFMLKRIRENATDGS